ncbi:hypothetical protein DPMN_013420 [Dreissena polymorpha]|uniref:Uncharacterized protein n=1 Tax=Dreissena polymorpha TaxID=45954 RepID=A0A9D4S2G6_DREPO|nr:hypothetical protein DPMN_013420 [Dreissena polymorpha]
MQGTLDKVAFEAVQKAGGERLTSGCLSPSMSYSQNNLHKRRISILASLISINHDYDDDDDEYSQYCSQL